MKIKMTYLIFAVGIVLFGLSIPADNSQKLDIVGSTSVQPICEKLAEEYKKSNPHLDINVQGGGSSLGIRSTNLNLSDIGMSSKEINDTHLEVHEIGREGIAVIVHPENNVNDLSTAQLRDIFSGDICEWDDGSEISVVVREEGSGTLNTFKDEVMGNVSIRGDAIVQNSAGSVKQSVMQDKNSIGFVSFCHVDGDVKAICLNGVEPSEESVKNRQYYLQRPFLFITNKNPSNETLDFINWVKSNKTDELLSEESIIRVG